jgi:hypothetical protein
VTGPSVSLPIAGTPRRCRAVGSQADACHDGLPYGTAKLVEFGGMPVVGDKDGGFLVAEILDEQLSIAALSAIGPGDCLVPRCNGYGLPASRG